MSDLRHQLDDLASAARAAAAPPLVPVVGGRLEDVLGGREVRDATGAYWLVETPVQQVLGTFSQQLTLLGGLDVPPGIVPDRTWIVDIETGGFAGTPVFLIGVVALERVPLHVVQFLARDYPEEETILRSFATRAAARDTWVTFNGKSFDEPFLRDRAAVHRVVLEPVRDHVDLLHAARRTWGEQVPNCRLVTLEEHILGRRRVGDVPSSDVPDLFHHFIRTGNAGPLRPVLAHNRLDVVTCVELLLRLARHSG